MKEEILDFIHEIEEDGLSDDEANLLNIIEFVITENEFDDDMLGDIYDGLENYLGDEDEELQGDFEEEMEEEEEEIEESEEGDISNQLIVK